MASSNSKGDAKVRLYIFTAFLCLWVAAICGRLVYLQVIRYRDYVQKAARQQQRTVDVSPRRGIIYDRNGQELAMSVLVDSVFAVPNEIPDQQMAANLLSRVLGYEPNELLARIRSQKNFVWLARKVDAETATRIQGLNLKGIYLQKETKRFYPKRELAAQVLGYVGTDDEGLAGIERTFDGDLRGNPGKMIVSIDARGSRLGRVERQPDPGANVVLTIDEKIQYIVEKELERAMEDTQAQAGTVIVQNPKTGEILALANRPTFNPNLQREITPGALKNRAVSDVYEPGSTFKIVTISAALEEKLTNPDEPIDCQMGSIVVNGMRIRDHEPLGVIPVSMVLAKSSDVGSIKLGLRLGNERLDSYIRKYGFGAQTGIELPGESRGLHKPVSRWSKVSIGAISMGQEIGVSAVQLVSMVSTIANDGIYTPPRIVAGLTPPSNNYQQVVFRPSEQHRVVSPMTAAQMRKMLEGVVLFGTGRKAILDGYTSAGKTGTAQKMDPRTGGYSKTNYVGSFAGFAPVNNPAVTIVVIIDSAKGLHQGGQVAAPVFTRVAQQVLAYLNVPHDAEIKNDPRRALMLAKVKDEDLSEGSPDHPGEPVLPEETPATVQPASFRSSTPVQSVAAPTTVAQNTAAPAQVATPLNDPNPAPARGTVVVDVEGGQVVPSLIGKPMRVAIESAQQAGFELTIVGSGVAKEQSPPPGTRLPAGSKIAVRFSR